MKTLLTAALLAVSTQVFAVDTLVECYKLSQDVGEMHELQRNGSTVQEWQAELKELVARGELHPEKYKLYVGLWQWTTRVPGRFSSSEAKYLWQTTVCDNLSE